jgi:cephalosporin hydroxylase
MNELELYFENNQERLMHKYQHYFDVYDRYFKAYKNQKITILEIGISHGGSLQMWKRYFGKEATIWGIYIDPRCKSLEEENIHVLIGSQEDPTFLQSVIEKIGPIDILIDDGGHTQNQQQISFEILFNAISPNGIYLCEDTHTSYWNIYGGGHKRNGSFTEYAKNLIDQINAHHSEQSSLQVNSFTKTANTIHLYDSIIVIEKNERKSPSPKMTGSPSFTSTNTKKTFFEKFTLHFLVRTNKILQKLKLPGYKINRMLELNSKL